MDKDFITFKEFQDCIKSDRKINYVKVKNFLSEVFEIGFSKKVNDIFPMSDFDYYDFLCQNQSFIDNEYQEFLEKNENINNILFHIAEFDFDRFKVICESNDVLEIESIEEKYKNKKNNFTPKNETGIAHFINTNNITDSFLINERTVDDTHFPKTDFDILPREIQRWFTNYSEIDRIDELISNARKKGFKRDEILNDFDIKNFLKKIHQNWLKVKEKEKIKKEKIKKENEAREKEVKFTLKKINTLFQQIPFKIDENTYFLSSKKSIEEDLKSGLLSSEEALDKINSLINESLPDAIKYEGKLWNNFISLKFGITVSDDLVHNLMHE